ESKRGKVIALHMVGGSLGLAIGPILSGIIADTLGWRYAFIILSVMPLIAVPVVLTKFKQAAHQESSEMTGVTSSAAGTVLKPVHRFSGFGGVWRKIAFVTVLAVLLQLVAGSAMAFIPIYLVDKHHIPVAFAAIWLGISRLGGIVGSLLGGWLSDKWGRRNAIILALGAVGPILYLLTKLQFNSGMIVVLVIFGMFMQMRQATVQPFLMDNTPPRMRATVFGIYFGLGMEGVSMVQPLAGKFMDIFGVADVFSVIAIVTVVFSLATIVYMALIPKLRQ
ncbi:MFS transporter, partial [Chloroflexota bacterium]